MLKAVRCERTGTTLGCRGWGQGCDRNFCGVQRWQRYDSVSRWRSHFTNEIAISLGANDHNAMIGKTNRDRRADTRPGMSLGFAFGQTSEVLVQFVRALNPIYRRAIALNPTYVASVLGKG